MTKRMAVGPVAITINEKKIKLECLDNRCLVGIALTGSELFNLVIEPKVVSSFICVTAVVGSNHSFEYEMVQSAGEVRRVTPPQIQITVYPVLDTKNVFERLNTESCKITRDLSNPSNFYRYDKKRSSPVTMVYQYKFENGDVYYSTMIGNEEFFVDKNDMKDRSFAP